MKKKLELTYADDDLFKELPKPKKTLKEIKDASKPPPAKKKYPQRNRSNYKGNRNKPRPKNSSKPEGKSNNDSSKESGEKS
jgi:hypothetical protein